MLNVDIFVAISLPNLKLDLLYNEATRQRVLDLIYTSKAFGGADKDEISNSLKIHGDYTDGFYEKELNNLFAEVKNVKR